MPRHRTGAIFQDDQGRWWARVRYKDEFGKRREKRRLCENKTDAKNKRDDLLDEIKAHGAASLALDKVTFEQLAAYYEKHYLTPAEYRDGRKIAGVRDYAKFKSALKPARAFFGSKRLRTIRYADLRNYRLHRLRSKSQRNDKKHLSVATVNRELSRIRRMFSIARQLGWMLVDPFKQGEPLVTPADEVQRERILTVEEENKLLAQCTGPREHLRAILICALDTGMRKSEILLLRWRDVDLDARLLTVAAMHTKTLRARQVGITPRLIEELKRLEAEGTGDPDSRVFGVTNNFKRSFATACRNAKIRDFRFHDARHTFASRLASKGMTNDLIARLLGHSQLRTTYRYVNVNEETALAAARLLS